MKKIKTSIFIVLSTVIFIIMLITIFVLHYSTLFQNSNNKIHQLEILSNEIIYQDEVLTMSALMYISSEDEKWKHRYEEHVVLLENALLKAITVEPFIKKVITQTSIVNNRLVEIEKKSFELIKSGDQASALALLFNDEYQELKQEYAQSTQGAIKLLHEYETSLKVKIINNANNLTVLLVLFVLFFIITWIYMIKYLRSSDKLLRKLVIKDVLTGLHNRRTFNDTLFVEVNRSKRQGRGVLLAICDVDNFKLYNDTYGHPAGDKVLASIGKIISQNSKRATEFSYRIGGEEFALIKSIDNHQEGRQWVESIIKEIECLAIEHIKNPPLNLVTISVGLTFAFDDKESSSDKLYEQADKALYQAKSTGKNCLIEFSSL